MKQAPIDIKSGTSTRSRESRSRDTTVTISLPEAASILGIHRTTAWSLYRRGEFPIPVLKMGSNLRVVRKHLQMFLETGEPVAPGRPLH
jgi:predicted DNA-binding transcriptional regulator AlpA